MPATTCVFSPAASATPSRRSRSSQEIFGGANSGLPWTILRVTQFYSYCFENSRKLAKFPLVAPVPGGFRVQPVDSREVAARLVELALGEPVGRALDMSGPEVSSWKDLIRSYLAATHRRKWVVPMPVPGSKAVRGGALLPPPAHTEGVRTWGQFLSEELLEHRSIIPARTI